MIEAIRVEAPGLFTTVQDLGRLQAISSGVQVGGAMDRFAHSSANLLVGNDEGLATLECTLTGPDLVAERSCLVAITGADLDPRLNGAPAPMWTGFVMNAGDRLTLARRRASARAYIAVEGGIVGDRWLGSASTNVMAGRGGMRGRALVAGDVIGVNESGPVPRVPGRGLDESMRPAYDDHTLHAVAGPHLGWLDAAGRAALFESTYTVGRDSNRMGYRLEGPELEVTGGELLSFGLIAGAVQLPGSGLPILLMADHQTAGGYPVMATAVSASLPIAAQLMPGDELRFAEIDLASALRMRRALRAALDSLRD